MGLFRAHFLRALQLPPTVMLNKTCSNSFAACQLTNYKLRKKNIHLNPKQQRTKVVLTKTKTKKEKKMFSRLLSIQQKHIKCRLQNYRQTPYIHIVPHTEFTI